MGGGAEVWLNGVFLSSLGIKLGQFYKKKPDKSLLGFKLNLFNFKMFFHIPLKPLNKIG